MLAWHKLRPVQALAANLYYKHKRLILVLPRQYGGKTELGCQLQVDLISRPFTKSALFLAKDHSSAKKATREKFTRLCDKNLFSVNTEIIYLKKHKTSAIFLASVDKDPDRNRGGTMAAVHWSEVAFSKIDKGETITGVFDKVIKPTLSLQGGYALLESTLNGKNGFYDIYNDAKAHKMHILHMGLGKMVELGLIAKDVYDLEKSQYHPDVFRQEFECEWVSFQGRAYPEFDEMHIDKDMAWPESWQHVLCAIDWGYRPSATCALFAYVKGGVLNIYSEHYKMEELAIKTAAAIATHKQHHGGMMTVVADHEPDRNEELNTRGIESALADKQNMLGARMRIKESLYFDTIRIHPRCEYLIKDLQIASWNDKKDGDLDYSVCNYGHMDAEAALRYLIKMIAVVEPVKPGGAELAAFDTMSAQAKFMEAMT